MFYCFDSFFSFQENYAYLEDYFERRRRERQRKNVTREELRSALAKIQAVMVGTVNTGCKESGNKLKLPGESSGESSSLCSVTPLTSGTSSTPSSGPSTSSAWVGSPKASGPRSSFKPPKPIFETGESQECEDYQEPKKPKRGDADSSEPSTPRGGGGRPITVTATIELPPHNRKSSSEDEDSL